MTTTLPKIEEVARRFALRKNAVNVNDRTVETAFSSEEPIEDFPGVRLILDHGAGADLSRLNDGGPVLLNHLVDQHVGVVNRAWIGDDRKGRAVLRFGNSALAGEAFDDVANEIRTHVSLRARIDPDSVVLDPSSTDERRVFRAMRWTGLEISLASVWADDKAAIGRTAPNAPKESNMDTNQQTPTPPAPAPAPASTVTQADVNRAEQAVVDRVNQILSIGEQYDVMDMAREALTTGMDIGDFKLKAADVVAKRNAKAVDDAGDPENADTNLDLTPKETKEYSICRAIDAQLERNWDLAPFEKECSDEIARRLGRDARGVFVPMDIQRRKFDVARGPNGQPMNFNDLVNVLRDMTTGGVGTGAEFVGERHSPENFIEQLRVTVQVIRLGARLLPGMRENLSIPKKTSGAAFTWLGESGTVTLSDLGTADVKLGPTTIGGGVKMSRRMLKQGSPAMDDLVMQDLGEGAGEAIDLGAIQGSGAANQPTGVVNQVGVNTQAVAAAGNPTYAETIGFRTAIASDNALRGDPAWITTSGVVGNAMVRTLDAGSGRFLMDPQTPGRMIGYRVGEQNAITANRIILGIWQELLIAMWGVLDLRPDPFTAADEDALIVRAFQDIDTALRHAESFCVNA